MKKHSKTTDIISLIVFSIGAMIGIAFNGLAAWADFEASLFDSALRGDDQLSGLRCPVFIGTNETGRLSAEIKNPLDRTIAPKIRAHVSDGFVSLLREIDQQPSLGPGATQTLEWTVTPADAVWGRFILFRAYQFPVYPIPTRSSTCGVLTTSVPFNGAWFTALTVIASVTMMSAGIGLWLSNNSPLKGRKRDTAIAMAALGVVTLAGIITALLGLMFPGLLIFILSFLLVLVLFAFFAAS